MAEFLKISYVLLKQKLNRITIDLSTKQSTPPINALNSVIQYLSSLTNDELIEITKETRIELKKLGLKCSISGNILTVEKEKS